MRKTTGMAAVAVLALGITGCVAAGPDQEPTVTETVTETPQEDEATADEQIADDLGVDLDNNPGLDLEATQALYEAEEECDATNISGTAAMVFSGMQLRDDDGIATDPQGLLDEAGLICAWNVLGAPRDLLDEIREYRGTSGDLQRQEWNGIIISWNWDDDRGLYTSLRAESDLDD